MIVRRLCFSSLLALPSIASACAVCDSEIGITVRAGLFNGSFLPTLLEVVTPFPMFGLVIYAMNHYLPD